MAIKESEPGLVPVERVAQELGTTALSVLMHIKRKVLDGREIEGAWYVTGESLASYSREGHEKGRTLCRSSCAAGSGCSTCG